MLGVQQPAFFDDSLTLGFDACAKLETEVIEGVPEPIGNQLSALVWTHSFHLGSSPNSIGVHRNKDYRKPSTEAAALSSEVLTALNHPKRKKPPNRGFGGSYVLKQDIVGVEGPFGNPEVANDVERLADLLRQARTNGFRS